MARHLRAALAGVLIIPALVATAPQAGAALDSACPAYGAGYPDVAPTDPHLQGIDCIAWWEITLGTGFGTYNPAGNVQREQMASFIARLVERLGGTLPDLVFDTPFDDVRYDNTHGSNIGTLAQVGLIQGTGPGTYSPAAIVTRGQMATFLVRAYEFANNRALPAGGDYFSDDQGATHEANINKAAAAGFAAGTGPGAFNPNGPVNRAQMATFMARVLDYAVLEGSAFTPVESFSLAGSGDYLGEPIRLRSGTYVYTYDHTGDCFYDPRLEVATDDTDWEFLASGSGPESGSGVFTGVEAGDYRFEMNAGGAEPCTWSMTLSTQGLPVTPPRLPPAPPAEEPPTDEPSDEEPPVEDFVTPGAYCDPEGANGETIGGVPMTCSPTSCDGGIYDKPRWRAADC